MDDAEPGYQTELQSYTVVVSGPAHPPQLACCGGEVSGEESPEIAGCGTRARRSPLCNVAIAAIRQSLTDRAIPIAELDLIGLDSPPDTSA